MIRSSLSLRLPSVLIEEIICDPWAIAGPSSLRYFDLASGISITARLVRLYESGHWGARLHHADARYASSRALTRSMNSAPGAGRRSGSPKWRNIQSFDVQVAGQARHRIAYRALVELSPVGVNAWRGWLPSGNDGKGHLHDRVSISVLGVIERRHGPSER